MTAGFLFPYRRTPIRYAPLIAPGYQVPYDPCVGGTPTTYNSKRHEVDCVISTGSPLHCRFGLEILRCHRNAVDLSLLDEGRLPLLNSHDSRNVLGRVVDVWIEDEKLYGTLRFDKSPAGLHAEAMISRGELSGISCWATTKQWVDEFGDPVSNNMLNNPSFSTWGRDGGPQTFTAAGWILNEVSLTSCPKDPLAVIL